MKELNRFIEVEINKDRVESLLTSEDKKDGTFTGPVQCLNSAASILQKLDLSSQNRLKKSLYEIYKT